jgi:hypothetical protein
VTKSLEPSQEEIDTLHQKYVDALLKLFYKHRDEFADADAQLTIV